MIRYGICNNINHRKCGDFGDCVAAITNATGGNSNAVRGLIGWWIAIPASNTIEYVTICNIGNAVDFGDRTSWKSDGV